MKKFSKIALILVLALTLLLSLSLIACGGDPKENKEIVFKVEGKPEYKINVSDGGEITFPDDPEVLDKFFTGWALEDGTPITKDYFKGRTIAPYVVVVAKFYSLGNFGAMPANFAIKETGAIDVSLLNNIISASDGEAVTITATAPDNRKGGNFTTVTVTATGKHGIKKTKEFTGIKVYGKPVIPGTIKSKIREDATSISSALGIYVNDSHGTKLNITEEILEGMAGNKPEGGESIKVKITAKDHLGKEAEAKIVAGILVYGNPRIERDEAITEIRESDVVDCSHFQLKAYDSFDVPIVVTTEIIGGNKDIDSNLRIKATAQDSNIENSLYSGSIEFNVLVKEDPICTYVNGAGMPESTPSGYLLFGSYPKTIKNEEVEILNENAPNAKGYYLGSDGLLYAKRTTAGVIPEAKFSNGKGISGSNSYYFQVERIFWKILTPLEAESWFLFSENILDGMKFDATEPYDNVYKINTIDSWLNANDGFYQKAFYAEQRGLIKPAPADGIFVLSEAQAKDVTWGFNEDSARQKYISDYSRANAVSFSAETQNGVWWLSSPSVDADKARMVMATGAIGDVQVNVSAGIVPGLWINIPIA